MRFRTRDGEYQAGTPNTSVVPSSTCISPIAAGDQPLGLVADLP